MQLRYDDIGNTALYKTMRGQRLGTIRADGVGQGAAGIFGQTEIEWSRVVRTTIGLRGDVMRFDVESSHPGNSGTGTDGIVSPKFTAVFGPWNDTEFYANAGLGFHSNDTRGATLTVDPKTGEPAESLTPLVRARFSDHDPAGTFIPGALDRVVSGGITVEPDHRIFGSLRLRHFGPRPLLEDASVRSKSTTIWNGEIGAKLSHPLRLSVDLFNLFDASVADIDYFYRSRLPDEPLEGVDDVHTHPSIPRTARVTLQASF